MQKSLHIYNSSKLIQSNQRKIHLQRLLETKTKTALKYCSPVVYKDLNNELKLPNTCKVLWDDIEEISEALSSMNSRIEKEQKTQLDSMYWYYDEDDVSTLFYDV
jgi:hypothetical protein